MRSRKSLRVSDYIAHILEAIDRIETYVAGLDQAAFIKNRMVQDAIIRNLEIIGEAANNIKTVDEAFL